MNKELSELNPNNREDWLYAGILLKRNIGDDGFDKWLSWSKLSSKFDDKSAVRMWESLKI